jgi:hypothetical protein
MSKNLATGIWSKVRDPIVIGSTVIGGLYGWNRLDNLDNGGNEFVNSRGEMAAIGAATGLIGSVGIRNIMNRPSGIKFFDSPFHE